MAAVISLLQLVAIAIAALTVAGCGGRSDTVTVVGRIAYDGAAVTSGVINFQPSHGQPLGGGISPEGTYSFELPPGEYRVRIDAPPPVPEDWKEGQLPPKLGPRLVPEKYSSFTSSGLTLTITGEEDPQTCDFQLP